MRRRGNFNKQKSYNELRIGLLFAVLFFGFGVVLLRCFYLQVWNYDYYSALAQGQHELYKTIFAERGQIYIKDGSGGGVYPVAINKKLNIIYVVPRDISEDKKEVVSLKLSQILGLGYEEVLAKVSIPNDPYEVIKNRVSDDDAALVMKEKMVGVKSTAEDSRYYPAGELASNVIGFVGYSGNEKKGQYGIEGYCNKNLEGERGMLEVEKDAFGKWISFGKKSLKSARDGDDITLTIDYTVQYLVEDELKKGMERYEADSGSIIVMNPSTGEIVAMAQYPNFDLNNYSKVSSMDVYLNSNIHDLYEPGSTQKVITMAIGLDSGKVTPSSTYTDEGVLKIDGWSIRNSDYQAHGVQNMTSVLEKSLNTGSVFVQQQVGKKVFYDYLKNFGLNSKTNIELGGESVGNLSNLEVQNDINYATASYGQGIAVTPLALLTAVSALANEGKLMKPYIINSYVNADGEVTKTTPTVVRQVVSSRTANLVSAMMVSVVKNGHAKNANIKGYKIAGKTGTAQIPSKDKKGYDPNKTIHTFVGFGPVPNPKFAILVKFDAPKARFAESTALPVFGKIAEELVKYYNLAPTEK